MPLGSLVVREESGYVSFFSRLLRPHEHYLPFWKEVGLGGRGRVHFSAA